MDIVQTPDSPQAFIEWMPEFELGIPELDDQHRVLFDLINALAGSIIGGETDATHSSIAQLLARSLAHFEFEEQLMQRLAYPASDLHNEQHSELLAAMERLQSDLMSRAYAVNRQRTLHFLRDWFSIHIVRTDRDFARFLIARAGAVPGGESRGLEPRLGAGG